MYKRGFGLWLLLASNIMGSGSCLSAKKAETAKAVN
jgi:hypothetical protein